LFEQFLGATSGFLSSTLDPCNQDRINSSPIRAANCAIEGIPTGFNATSGITVFSNGGAAAGLKAETSTNFTVGTIIQPDFGSGFGNLSLAVDYYRIKVRNGVSKAGAGNILSLCYDDPQFRAGGGFCRLINARVPGSNALVVNDSYVNLSTDIVRGIDYTLRYTRDLGIGKLRLNAEVSQYFDQASKLFDTDPLDDVNGTINNPKMSGNFSASYEVKKWTLRATTQFKFDVPDYFLHDMSVRYRTDKTEVTIGVKNMFDKKPPQISSGLYSRQGNSPYYSGYDFMGRRFFLNVSRDF
jgi:outer membrane receptor protein involved in Fe transport